MWITVSASSLLDIRLYDWHCISCVQDFRKIASHLRDRSIGDCVKYYYRNQKLDEFAAVRRKQQLKKRRMQSQEKSRQYLGGRAAAAQGVAPPAGALSCSLTDRRRT